MQIEESQRRTEFLKETYEHISQFDWKNFTDKNLTRQLKMIADLGISVLPVDEVLRVRAGVALRLVRARVLCQMQASKLPLQLSPFYCFPPFLP